MGLIGRIFNKNRVGPTIENDKAAHPANYMTQAELQKRNLKTAADMAYTKKYEELMQKSNISKAEARAAADVERASGPKSSKLDQFAHKIQRAQSGFQRFSKAMNNNPMFSGQGMNQGMPSFGPQHHKPKAHAPTNKVISHYVQQGEKMIPVYKIVKATAPKKQQPEYPRWY
jgi:hypothetical protein